MKIARLRAFTLIELLVVIAIIIVLAGLLFTVGPAVTNRAYKVQAASDVNSIVNGVKSYYTDYGQYPLTGAQQTAGTDAIFGDTGSGAVANSLLFNALRAKDDGMSSGAPDPAKVPNPRLVAYVQPRDAKDAAKPTAGIAPSGKDAGKWVDPWGVPYLIFLDANYDAKLDVSSVYTGSNNSPVQTDVGVASFGKDKQAGNAGDGNYLGGSSDDVVSWR